MTTDSVSLVVAPYTLASPNPRSAALYSTNPKAAALRVSSLVGSDGGERAALIEVFLI